MTIKKRGLCQLRRSATILLDHGFMSGDQRAVKLSHDLDEYADEIEGIRQPESEEN